MKISIITVCFNAEKTIRQTIESVLAQSYSNIEYIVVDGASKDGTVAILKEFEGKIKYISEPDKGIYDAMNKGVKMATGDVIGTIGSDDFFNGNDVIEAVNKHFETQKTDAIYGDIQFVNPGKEDVIVRKWVSSAYDKNAWLFGWMPPHPCFYIKRVAFETYGYFETHFKCAGDYEFMLRMLYKNNLSASYLNKTLVTMRNGGTSTASLKHRYVANMEDRAAWKLNGLKPRWYTLWLKPISKIRQLFV